MSCFLKSKALIFILGISGLFVTFNSRSMMDLEALRGNKSYESVTDAAKQGACQSIAGNVKKIGDNLLSIFPKTVKTSWIALGVYMNRFVFGTKPLSAKKLSLMKNHIESVVAPFQVSSGYLGGNRDEDSDFRIKKEAAINELNHIIKLFEKSLLAYSPKQYKIYNPSVFNIKSKFMILCQLFTLLENEEISFYIIKNIEYISNIIDIFQESESLEDLNRKFNDIKHWRHYIKSAFEQLNSLISLDTGSTGISNEDLLRLMSTIKQ